MFFAITALGVSVIQIAIGVAIGLALRKQRQRRRAALGEDDVSDTLPVEWSEGETDESLPSDAASVPTSEADVIAEQPRRDVDVMPAGSAAAVSPGKTSAARGPVKGTSKKTAPEPVEKPTQRNRRKSPRRPFQYRQQVAPYHGGMLPGKASFREVECQDISSTGFSFLSSQLPDFDSIVVALGIAPQQVYLWAHIVSRFPLDDGPAPLYRIGCRFVGPVNP